MIIKLKSDLQNERDKKKRRFKSKYVAKSKRSKVQFLQHASQ